MESPSLSSRQPIRPQVLHSSIAACSRPTVDVADVEVPIDPSQASSSRHNVPRFPGENSEITGSAVRRRQLQYPPSREEQQQQLLRDIQKRYKVDLMPNIMQFRASSNVGDYRLSADICKPRKKNPYISFGVKMQDDPVIVKKVVLTPQHSDVRVHTPSMELGIFRLQFALGYNWQRRSWGFSWRSKTKWTRGNKIQRRWKPYVNDMTEVSTFWNIRSELPQMGGSFGTDSSSIQTDIGRLFVGFERLKVSLQL